MRIPTENLLTRKDQALSPLCGGSLHLEPRAASLFSSPVSFALLQVSVNCTPFFNPLQTSVLRKALQFSPRHKCLRNASCFVSAVYSDGYEIACNSHLARYAPPDSGQRQKSGVEGNQMFRKMDCKKKPVSYPAGFVS